jgi:hypothetical protein
MFIFSWTAMFALAAARNVASAPTPTVDLGYGLWEATMKVCFLDLLQRSQSLVFFFEPETAHHYNFRNIRYARPPVGDLRWAPPQPPLVNHTVINDGQTGVVCPQGVARWAKERALFVHAYLSGNGSDSAFTNEPPPGLDQVPPFPPLDPRTSEGLSLS